MKTFTKSEVLEAASHLGGICIAQMLEAYAATLPEEKKLIDWSKMPIDTVVDLDGCIRYYAGMDGDNYMVFEAGRSSKTAKDFFVDCWSPVAVTRPKLAPAEMQPWILGNAATSPFPAGILYAQYGGDSFWPGAFYRAIGYVDGWE